MAELIFKGFKFINGTVEGFNPSTLDTEDNKGLIFFIRTDADKKDGYIYFNGKSYGTASDVRETVETLVNLVGSEEIKDGEGEVISGATGLFKKIEEAIESAQDGRVDTLIGEDSNKSVREIVSEELASQLIPEDAQDAFDTLEEIAAWIQAHPADASAMNQKINALETALGNEAKDAEGTEGKDDFKPAVLASGIYEKIENLDSKIEEAVGDIPTYEAGLGVEFAEGEATSIKAKIANVEGKTNYLTVDENGLAVSNDDFSKIKTTKDITVAGLSSAMGTGEIKNDTVIPAGTSLQDFLEKLLVKEIIQESGFRTYSAFTATYTMPSFSLTPSSTNLEIGTKVTTSAVSGGSSHVNQVYSAGTFTYGYADDAEGTNYVDSRKYDVKVTPELVSENTNFRMTFDKFGSPEAIEGASIAAQELVVAPGKNEVILYASGNTFASQAVDSKDLYIASNLKKYKKSNGNDNVYKTTAYASAEKVATGNVSKTVTGYYKMFYGYAPALAAGGAQEYFNSEEYDKVSLKAKMNKPVESSSDPSNITSSLKGTEDYPSIVIAMPSKYNITALTDGLGNPFDGSIFNKVNVNYRNGDTVTPYTIWVRELAGVVEYKDVKIK